MFLLFIGNSIFISGLLLLGATTITGIYNFFSYIQYREKIILNYCFYLFAITAYIFCFLLAGDPQNERHAFIDYARESMNVLTILTYTYFMYEAVYEWNKTYPFFFKALRFIMFTTIGYCLFMLIAGMLQWENNIISQVLPMTVRAVFLIMALLCIKFFFTKLSGPFLNLVKWGAVAYLFFVLIVIAGFFTPGSKVLGLDQMIWTFIGTFVEITIFSIAMSYKVKALLGRTQEMRNRISKDLHDEVGATLSGVTLMSELASQRLRSNRIEDSQALIERITDESKEMSEKMNDIVWAINPANDSIEKVLNKIQAYGKNICSSKDIQFHFVRPEMTEATHINMQVRNNIYLISKEAINNAVKYSGGKNIRLSLITKKDSFFMKIEDDGKGFNVASETLGNGLTNMKARAAEIGGQLQIHSDIDKGTRIELYF